MSTTATARQHKPWCNEHGETDPGHPRTADWCCRHVDVGGVFVDVVDDASMGSPVSLTVWSDNASILTPTQARRNRSRAGQGRRDYRGDHLRYLDVKTTAPLLATGGGAASRWWLPVEPRRHTGGSD